MFNKYCLLNITDNQCPPNLLINPTVKKKWLKILQALYIKGRKPLINKKKNSFKLAEDILKCNWHEDHFSLVTLKTIPQL